jgi:hypothetical protein
MNRRRSGGENRHPRNGNNFRRSGGGIDSARLKPRQRAFVKKCVLVCALATSPSAHGLSYRRPGKGQRDERMAGRIDMANMIKKTALVAVFGIAATACTFAQDWRDVNRDRRDIRSEQVDARQDYNRLRRDEMNHNWAAVRRDKADINRDRAETRNQRVDVRHDRRDYHRW